MKRTILVWVVTPFLITIAGVSCQKEFTLTKDAQAPAGDSSVVLPVTDFTSYTIPAGGQYCLEDHFETIATSRLAFTVQFDSSAIYATKDPANQADINKLYGFSDNRSHHHQFSARFGWRWYDNKLTLHGYIYNDSIREYKELGAIAIGKPAQCAILVRNNAYSFVLNGDTTSMRRTSKTTQAEGYRLYPYFGGDELAPHQIRIQIKELK